MSSKKTARIRVAGPDHKGIIATVTTHLFKKNINIEDIDQRILEGFLVMNMLVDLQDLSVPLPAFREDLKKVGRGIGMEITLQIEEGRKFKNVALLVTRETHCLDALLKGMKEGKIRGRPVVLLSNRPDLEEVALKARVPFFWAPSDKRKEHESFLLEKLAAHDVDLVVLARYMQILSPEFCFRYEGRIINIHPSLLPSFPGSHPYSQAYNKGVEVVGVTAHFVTTDLDQGPIICQDSLRINKAKDTLEDIAKRGKKLEAAVLKRAVCLFCEDRLVLRRGKVIDSRNLHKFEQKMREFYSTP